MRVSERVRASVQTCTGVCVCVRVSRLCRASGRDSGPSGGDPTAAVAWLAFLAAWARRPRTVEDLQYPPCEDTAESVSLPGLTATRARRGPGLYSCHLAQTCHCAVTVALPADLRVASRPETRGRSCAVRRGGAVASPALGAARTEDQTEAHEAVHLSEPAVVSGAGSGQ